MEEQLVHIGSHSRGMGSYSTLTWKLSMEEQLVHIGSHSRAMGSYSTLTW